MNYDFSKIEDNNKPTFWCYRFVEELYALGLRHVIISPGSRSTPLALSFDVHAGFIKQVVLDERSAAYIGLGIGKTTGVPAVLVCTSGTAAANYFPAIIEARQSETPLLVLTADRPPNQRFIGSSQTIDQTKLYGDYPLFFHDAGEPVLQNDDLNRLSVLACQAAETCMIPGGPVHINFPFRKPLEPGIDFLGELHDISTLQISNSIDPYLETSRSKPETSLPDDILTLINRAKRPVVISGPRSVFQPGGNRIIEFAERISAPLLAESSSQVKGKSQSIIRGYDSFLRSVNTRQSLEPDLIIRTGKVPVSKGLELLLKNSPKAFHVHLYESETPQNAFLLPGLRTKVDWETLDISGLEYRTKDNLRRWQQQSNQYQQRMVGLLNKANQLADPHVYFDLISLIPKGFNIVLSNSFPVRDFDMFGDFSNDSHSIIVNRGAAGIDGVTSTAIGTGLGNNKGTVLFTGDLAFLHDTNALQQIEEFQKNRPLVIIVVNNQGGSIFRMLPFDEKNDQYFKLFETPQSVNINDLVKAHNGRVLSVSNRGDMITGFKSLVKMNSLSVLECVTNSDASMHIRQSLWK
ncbi:MAG: 2-succinyl-5-enolpyruvyl-6-hydroxy-3-cyclohexene-1-carboxylic-acid synthase [Balneolales bacterium]